MDGLRRRLGVPGATAIGVASMLGAGIFFVWSPAAALAGWWMLAALVVAAFLAALNALSTTQLAMLTPVAGGAYVFGRDRVSPSVGFVAGTLFLVGKTASVAAIAVVAGGYISDHGRIVPVLLVLALAAVNATGIRSTAWTSAVLAAIVVSGLVASLVVGGATTVPHLPDSALPGGPLGAAQAVALVFFGFAGYARVATLAEEVRDPRRTLPRAVLLSLALVLVLSVATATVLLVGLGPAALATTDSPVAQLVGPAWRPLVVVLAGLAGAGALLGVLAGLSRTALAMARGGDLPGPLVRVWHRTGAPVVAEITVALVGALGAALLDPTALVGVSACAVLGYYGIAHLSALRIPGGPGRWLPRAVPVLGLVGCLVVSLATPWPALLGVVAAVLLALAGRALVRARHRA